MGKYIIDEETLKGLADALRKVTGQTRSYTPTEMIDAVTTIMETGTYILVDEEGNEVPAVFVENETVLTATQNDIRLGATAVTNAGVVVGEKFIPPYYTSVGMKLIPAGSNCVIKLIDHDAYDYTALQCIICPYAGSMEASVSTEKVAIDNKVYPVNATTILSEVIKNSTDKTIELGIVNDSDVPCVIRYFTYKEEI